MNLELQPDELPDTAAQLRIDLAAAFRIAAAFGWTESVGNHFSVVTTLDGKNFLMNPKWKHFFAINAYDLQCLNAQDNSVMQSAHAPDLSAWAIHSQLHALIPKARCIIHLHPPYAVALSTLKDPTLYPVCGNTARFFEHVAVDLNYEGIANEEAEGERLSRLLEGDKNILMMGNHGVLVTGQTVAAAFEDMYFFEKACQTLILAYSSGRQLNVLSDDIARKTAEGWKPYAKMAGAHFAQLKGLLDGCGNTYASLTETGKPQVLRF
jgi:ribulose-5-phosphate 4-epimerase/fuculose-1-phosphate aldolase